MEETQKLNVLKEEMKKDIKFSLDNFEKYLEIIKDYCIALDINLDRNQINKQITDILNDTLLHDIKDEKLIFKLMMDKYNIIEKTLPQIEQKIQAFNLKEQKYFIDVENVFYVTFFKQIQYIVNLLDKLNIYLSNKINIVNILCFIIKSLYDNPKVNSTYYIFILKEIITSDGFKSKYNIEVQNLLIIDVIEIIDLIIKMIYEGDVTLKKLYADWNNDKITVEKLLNGIDYDNKEPSVQDKIMSPNQTKLENLEKEEEEEEQELKGGQSTNDTNADNKKVTYKTVAEVNKVYLDKKKILFDAREKRKIDTKVFLNDNLLPIINFKSTPNISKEIWNAFNLFIFNMFEVSWDEYTQSLSTFIKQKSINSSYNLEKDEIGDLKIIETSFVPKSSSNTEPSVFTGRGEYDTMAQTGGNDMYFKKYLKYKQKYMELKK